MKAIHVLSHIFLSLVLYNTMALGAGTHTFYSRPLDELLVAGKTRTTSVELFDSDSAPNKPTAISAPA